MAGRSDAAISWIDGQFGTLLAIYAAMSGWQLLGITRRRQLVAVVATGATSNEDRRDDDGQQQTTGSCWSGKLHIEKPPIKMVE